MTTDPEATRRRDALLIKKTLAGKSQAFAQLMSLYKKRVFSLGMGFFHNDADSEDFVQEVFIKAYRNLSAFRGDSLFSTWITRIAYTTAVNSINRRKEYESIADETLIPSPIDTPEDSAIKEATRRAVKQAVAGLPPKYAVCIDLYFFYDTQYDEIATITGLPLNTIKSHIFRAKKLLRQSLGDFGDAE